MTFQAMSEFARSWGLVSLVVMFSVAVVYALWPSNQTKFNKAAHMPLDEEQEP